MTPRTFRTVGLAIAAGMTLAACTEPAAPTWRDAADLTYGGIYDQPVTLNEGKYKGEPFVVGGAARPRVMLVPGFIRRGDLDGDGRDDAVVLLSEYSGGSGRFDYLAAVTHRDGGFTSPALVSLGDRVQVIAAKIRAGAVELRVVQAGDDDAACCPGEVAERVFELRDESLFEVGENATRRLTLADATGREWRLTSISGNAPPVVEPPITLRFADGGVTGSSGCNTYHGQVVAGVPPGQITIDKLAGTRRACAELAMGLERRFVAALGNARRFGFRATRLVITFEDDGSAGTLAFE